MKCPHVFAFAVFVALLSVPVFGCKPNVESRNSIVTVTVTGDEHTVVQEPNTFQVNNGTQWQDVKARIRVTYADGFEGDGWKLGGKDGMGLSDDYRFTKNATVFALSKQKHISAPITITVNADEGYGLRPEHTLTVEKGSLWKDIKTQAEGMVMLKDGRITDGWKRGTSEGAYLDDADTFTKDETVCAVSRKSTDPAPARITITVTGDEGVTVNSPVTFSAVSGAMWKNLKAAAEARITVKEKHAVKEWRLTGKDGETLTGAKTFIKDETVFAGTEELKDVPADSSLFETDGNGTITGYTCAKNDLPKVLVIPGKIGEEIITKIGRNAFAETPIEQLNLSQADSLIEIGEYSFGGCEEMAGTLIFPATLTTIGANAFYYCTKLQGLNISSCTKLTEIGESAFYKCKEMAGTLVFPAKLKTIGREAFMYCTGLTGIDTSACTALTEIGESAFYECKEMAGTLVFPATLTTIGAAAFYGCKKLQSLNISSCTALTEIGERAFCGCEKMTGTLVFPATLTTIGAAAFKYCKKLQSLNISSCTALTEIGESAFGECEEMAGTLVFPATLTTIGAKAFKDCKKLQSINISACTELTEIAPETFRSCENLMGIIVFPANVRSIKGKNEGPVYLGAFEDCKKLQGIDFSACTALTEIGEAAFSGCKEMTGIIYFPASLKELGSTAFYGCAGLTGINISVCTELTQIGERAFCGCAELRGIISFPANLQKINSSSFVGCKKVQSFDFSVCTNLTEIGSQAFDFCEELQSVDLSLCTRLTTIGEEAFYACRKAVVKLPESIIELGSGAFGYPISAWSFGACKRVFIKSGAHFDRIKALVTGEPCKYPASRIESY